MNIFNRITATLSGSIESAVTQLENHEAVVHATLKEARASAAKAQVRLDRVKRDGIELQKKLENLRLSRNNWESRAAEHAETDEEKALECLRRMNHCSNQVIRLEKAFAQHEVQEQSLQSTVERIRARILEIESAKNLLRTRETAAIAQRSAVNLESTANADLDNVLERWEMKVLEVEVHDSICESVDAFELEFTDKEDTENLKLQLSELKKGEK